MDGILSLFKSRKIFVIVAGLVVSWAVRRYHVDETLANQVVYGALGLAGLIAYEDAAKSKKGQPDAKK